MSTLYAVYMIIGLVVIGDTNGDIWNYKRHLSSFEFTTIKLLPDVNIITQSSVLGSLHQCAYTCSRERSLSLYYMTSTMMCFCNNATDENIEDPQTENITYGILVNSEHRFVFGNFKKFIKFPYQQDCLALHKQGFVEDGVYLIQPVVGSLIDTWCDMSNGGWTVFQRRQDGSVNFYRDWTDYVDGFGNMTGEYWLGLENIYLLTQESTEMEISLDTFGDISPLSETVHYSDFSIIGSVDYYRLTCTGYSGNCGNSMNAYSNGQKFTTFDNDQDTWPGNCAVTFQGAWWYKGCHEANLNGRYLGGPHTTFADGINWNACWGRYYSVKTTVMKLKRKNI